MFTGKGIAEGGITMKKAMCILLASILAAGTLAGCGGSGKSEESKGNQTAKESDAEQKGEKKNLSGLQNRWMIHSMRNG